ncbi:hypothetical protein NDU88_007185 [Pleurodeles waltl]|uniref:Uncharacterized protein n=1 Tax=Pleurodeles waltl TaxID=8319 RepID=A0AAV7N1J6_PLEWA|nr:hypothetical protein NDU88_007185 [Pleurodeles waltl]
MQSRWPARRVSPRGGRKTSSNLRPLSRKLASLPELQGDVWKQRLSVGPLSGLKVRALAWGALAALRRRELRLPSPDRRAASPPRHWPPGS